ncbi:MAG TPA: GNAT family N-acetyltransferase [Vicinamibacteria bacterium]|nr:GNAT family N-acetyltransferase [Vicinamibacteria bacterium]
MSAIIVSDASRILTDWEMAETSEVWQRLDRPTPESVEAVCQALSLSAFAERIELPGDPQWIAHSVDSESKSLLLYTLGGQRLAGLASFFVHPSTLRLALGELTFLSRPVRRLTAFAPPIVDAAGSRERERDLLSALLVRIRADLAPDEALFFEGVPEETAFFELLQAPEIRRCGFYALRFGKLFHHRFATVPEGYESYLRNLGARTRSDLRSTRKKFYAHVGDSGRIRCFRDPSEVGEFLSDATAISRKTYQHRLLGAGLRDPGKLERRYRSTAELGWFRSYVLYAGKEPVAFQVGHVYRGTFHAQEIGYDPEWARYHVGILLHTEILMDLSTGASGVKRFDFGNDDSLHKQRLSTDSRREGYFYLIPATLRGAIMAKSMHATNGASAALGAILGRFGARRRVRDFFRRLGVNR